MTNDQVNDLVHTKVIGLSLEPITFPEHNFRESRGDEQRDYCCDNCGKEVWADRKRFVVVPCIRPKPEPRQYASSLDACALMEARIAEQGKFYTYVNSLRDIVDYSKRINYFGRERVDYETFLVITAAPLIRCIAALKAFGVDVRAINDR